MPLARFPLWAIARTSPPVFFSYSASHFQRARGLVLPSGGIGLVDQCGGELALREHADQLHRYADAFTPLDALVPIPADRIREDVLLAGTQVRKEAHVVRVIGDHQKIERTGQAGRRPVARDDFVTASKTIPVVESEPVSKRSCIHRDIGVQVRVAPKRPARKAALRVGRVRLAGVGFGEHRLSIFGRWDLSDHGCHCGQGACEQDTERNTLHDFPLPHEPTSLALNAAMSAGSFSLAVDEKVASLPRARTWNRLTTETDE